MSRHFTMLGVSVGAGVGVGVGVGVCGWVGGWVCARTLASYSQVCR